MYPKPGPAMYVGFPPHTLETSAIATLCHGTPSSSEAPRVFTVELNFKSNRFPWSFSSVISGILRHFFKKRLQTARGWMLRLNMGLSGLMPTWPAYPWKLLHEAMGCRAWGCYSCLSEAGESQCQKYPGGRTMRWVVQGIQEPALTLILLFFFS